MFKITDYTVLTRFESSDRFKIPDIIEYLNSTGLAIKGE
jgi:hypothetical protein